MDQINPKEIVKFVRYIAAGIDASAKPSRNMVASDIRCAIAAVNGNEKAINHVRSIISGTTTDEPRIDIKFSGPLSRQLIERAATEVAKRRPGFRGKKLQFTLSAKIA